MTWLSMALPFPVTYKSPQMRMRYPLLGAVLHTTNHTAGKGSLGRFQGDWQGAQAQSAHFMVDRSGAIGQFRNLTDVAWHVNKWSVSYLGIEHIAHPDERLGQAQIESSAQILAWCSDNLKIPLVALGKAGDRGIGIHIDFAPTRCGRGAFWTGGSKQSGQFAEILDAARSYQDFGLYQPGTTDV